MRVLHCLGSLRRGGIETWLVNMVRVLPPDAHFDFVLESQPGESGAYEDEVQQAGCRVFHLPPASRLENRLRVLGLQRDPKHLFAVLRDVRPDVFHVHGEEFMGERLRAARRAGVIVRVAHCHNTRLARGKGGPEMWARRVWARTGERRLLNAHGTDFVACSREAGRLLLGRKWNTTKSARVVFCGVPTDVFAAAARSASRQKLLRRFKLSDDAWVVGHAGSMGPTLQKNHGFLLRVFRELATRSPRWVLFLAGDGPLRPAIERLAEELGVRHRLVLPGLCSDVPALMSHLFDVHVMPSLFEGLPVAGIEACGAGLFTVCSDSITSELGEHLPGRVKYLSLSAPLANWVDEVEKGRQLRTDPATGLALLRASPFSMEASVRGLISIYRRRLSGSRDTEAEGPAAGERGAALARPS